MTSAIERVHDALRAVGSKSNGGSSWTCPAHEDRAASLSVNEGQDGRVLLHCFAGCSVEAIVKAVGFELSDLFPRANGRAGAVGGEGYRYPPKKSCNTATPTSHGLTLADYAAAKRLPKDFLRRMGLREVPYFGAPGVLIPYFDTAGADLATRYRLQLEKGPEGDERFRWKKGSKIAPYGLWRLEQARVAGFVVLVEGESDAQTCWLHDVPALGLPGADTWRDEFAREIEGIARVYAIVEPDRGGATLRAALAASPLRDRLHFVELGDAKDPSGLYLRAPDGFRAAFEAALARAIPATAEIAAEAKERAAAAWDRCGGLARDPRILDRFIGCMEELGAVGEARAAKLLFLVLMTRLLARLVSAVVKGPSSAGKSFTTECVLRFFPPSAYYELSGMSERFLVYDREPLAHRMIVISEASALEDGFAVYLVRTLLSEGRLLYGTVEKTEDGDVRGRRIEKPGPTGVILTTTAIRLHGENETRLFSIPVDDTREQTARVMRSIASGREAAVCFDEWHALQEWIESGERQVEVPFANTLASRIPPLAVRLRRDFGALLSLIRAHALLHRASRESGPNGVVAIPEDYAAVRELVADIIGDAAQATVSKTIRETVAAVAGLIAEGRETISVTELGQALRLDKSAASRRYDAARVAGYLRNLEERRGRPARIVLGEPLPAEVEILPPAEVLQCCSSPGGDTRTPLPPCSTGTAGAELF